MEKVPHSETLEEQCANERNNNAAFSELSNRLLGVIAREMNIYGSGSDASFRSGFNDSDFPAREKKMAFARGGAPILLTWIGEVAGRFIIHHFRKCKAYNDQTYHLEQVKDGAH